LLKIPEDGMFRDAPRIHPIAGQNTWALPQGPEPGPQMPKKKRRPSGLSEITGPKGIFAAQAKLSSAKLENGFNGVFSFSLYAHFSS
jgi:hypothetical protein